MQQVLIGSYPAYEAQFMKLWIAWEASLPEGERAPNFLQKERFLAGLAPSLQEKVNEKFPEDFEEAMQIARMKDQKLQFQANAERREQPPPTATGILHKQPPTSTSYHLGGSTFGATSEGDQSVGQPITPF